MSGATEPTARERRRERRKRQRKLKSRQSAQAPGPQSAPALPNRMSEYANVEQEREGRQAAATKHLQNMRGQMPVLLGRLAKIPDPRDPEKIRHKMTMVLLYGILMFVYQMGSRRQANQKLTRPQFKEQLALAFPELEQMPHHDTLNRLLSQIEVDQIREAQSGLIRRLIRKKKFVRYLVQGRYPVAIDGTQKHVSREQLSEEWLRRHVKDGQERVAQHYVYVLEANLALRNGMSIPLATEFLAASHGDTDREKQDCELRAFKRLASWIKKQFPLLPLLLLLGGLYPSGPLMMECRRRRWDFMIVLQDKSLPTVWEEYEGLKGLQGKNQLIQKWGPRTQRFQWVNQIEYEYGAGKTPRRILLNVVVCSESWEEIDDNGNVLAKNSRHAWISSQPLSSGVVHERCNLGAPSLGDRIGPAGREVPGLPLRTLLLFQLERDEGVSLPDAAGTPDQCPGAILLRSQKKVPEIRCAGLYRFSLGNHGWPVAGSPMGKKAPGGTLSAAIGIEATIFSLAARHSHSRSLSTPTRGPTPRSRPTFGPMFCSAPWISDPPPPRHVENRGPRCWNLFVRQG